MLKQRAGVESKDEDISLLLAKEKIEKEVTNPKTEVSIKKCLLKR